MPDVVQLVVLCLLGLVSGTVGGMLGIGGSVVMIPALAIVLGPNQHLYQAAAMIVNVFVALPATIRHSRAKAVRWDVAGKLLPFAIAMILIGVLASDQFDAVRLQRIFGVFLVYIVGFNLVKLFQRREEPTREHERTGWKPIGSIGSVMGFLAGLLGVGGGAIVVPLLQRIAKLPLRNCIATSSAVMCISAGIGAVAKNATLAQHIDPHAPAEAGRTLLVSDSLMIAAILIPSAFLGGMIGAGLTHRLPLSYVRVAFVLLMSWAALRMLGLA